MSRSAWTWRYEPEGVSAAESPEFGSQSDAESWLGEAWRDLAEAGVTAVILLNEDAKIYGPMSLGE
jgi:hypothetical protein